MSKKLSILISVSFLINLAAFSQGLNNGVVLNIPVDNGNIVDSTGRTITNVGSATVKDRFGNAGSAVYFNGNGANFTVDSFGLYCPTDEITISFWLKPLTVQSHNVCMMMPYNAGNDLGVSLYYDHNGTPSHFWDFQNLSNGRLWIHPVTLDTNWHCMTMTSSKSGNTMEVFKNGVSVGNKTGYGVFTNEMRDLKVGGGKDLDFKGYIDEIRIYNRVLSTTEISNLCNINSTSVQRVSIDKKGFSVYPNPAGDRINIRIADWSSFNQKAELTIMSNLGQMVRKDIITSNQTSLDISVLSTGVYILKLKNYTGGTYVKKLVVQ